MQTYSHFFVNWAINKRQKRQIEQGKSAPKNPIVGSAFLLGSVMPDIPLFILTAGFVAWRQWISPSDEFVFGQTYDDLFFNNPFWVAPHNFFHAPLILLMLAGVGYFYGKQGKGWGRWLFWFAVGCAIHTTADIFTHHNDGPLLLFPFNWQLRFSSPVSYWDTDHYAAIFAPLEHLMDLGIIAWGVVLWRQARRAQAGV